MRKGTPFPNLWKRNMPAAQHTRGGVVICGVGTLSKTESRTAGHPREAARHSTTAGWHIERLLTRDRVRRRGIQERDRALTLADKRARGIVSRYWFSLLAISCPLLHPNLRTTSPAEPSNCSRVFGPRSPAMYPTKPSRAVQQGQAPEFG